MTVFAGNWCEDLMKSMFYVTQLHGASFPHEIERLWCTVAANKRNVITILEFLISKPANVISQACYTFAAPLHNLFPFLLMMS